MRSNSCSRAATASTASATGSRCAPPSCAERRPSIQAARSCARLFSPPFLSYLILSETPPPQDKPRLAVLDLEDNSLAAPLDLPALPALRVPPRAPSVPRPYCCPYPCPYCTLPLGWVAAWEGEYSRVSGREKSRRGGASHEAPPEAPHGAAARVLRRASHVTTPPRGGRVGGGPPPVLTFLSHLILSYLAAVQAAGLAGNCLASPRDLGALARSAALRALSVARNPLAADPAHRARTRPARPRGGLVAPHAEASRALPPPRYEGGLAVVNRGSVQ